MPAYTPEAAPLFQEWLRKNNPDSGQIISPEQMSPIPEQTDSFRKQNLSDFGRLTSPDYATYLNKMQNYGSGPERLFGLGTPQRSAAEPGLGAPWTPGMGLDDLTKRLELEKPVQTPASTTTPLTEQLNPFEGGYDSDRGDPAGPSEVSSTPIADLASLSDRVGMMQSVPDFIKAMMPGGIPLLGLQNVFENQLETGTKAQQARDVEALTRTGKNQQRAAETATRAAQQAARAPAEQRARADREAAEIARATAATPAQTQVAKQASMDAAAATASAQGENSQYSGADWGGGNVGAAPSGTASGGSTGGVYGGQAAPGGVGTAGSVFGGNTAGSGEGGGSGGDKIICTALYHQGLLSEKSYLADQAYGLELARTDPDVMAGYHAWARPVAKAIDRSKIFARIMAPVATPWAHHIAGNENRLGAAYMRFGVPACRVIGRAVRWLKEEYVSRETTGESIRP